MNVRDSDRQSRSVHDLEFLQESISNLPKREPRADLKQEVLVRVLAEVRQEEPITPKRRRGLRITMRTLKLSSCLTGAALAVALIWALLPHQQTDLGVAVGNHPLDGRNVSQQIAQEIALKKGDSSDRLLRQTIPHQNGQYIGEGVEVLINDKQARLIRKGAPQSEIESNYDLQRLVQEIYTSGGQIVMINGILVKPYTEIIARGLLTEVSDHRIQSPFSIKVIGDSETLYNGLSRDSSVLMNLKNEKEIDVHLEKSQLVTISMNN